MKGDHRHYRHPYKRGIVTIAGHPGDDVVNRYAIVIEKANGNYSAYALDVPGCIATGKTVDETRRRLVDALESHLELMREDGETIPPPSSFAEYVDIA